MKVKMLKSTAGAGGNIRPGSIIDVSETEAKLLINSGFAVSLEVPTEAPKKKKKGK